jgi:hypothetical protein
MADSKEGEGNQIAGKFKVISDNSQSLITWSLSIIGGSIVAIVGSSYLRPDSIYWRLPYFLFIPGWIHLALSIHKGHEISRRYIASIFTNKPQALIDIGQAINTCYDRQLAYFERALIFFATWLAFLLLWWIIK